MTLEAPSQGRFEAGAHFLPVRVYYEDTDFSSLVYHANYLRFMERGRSDFLRLAGVSHRELATRPEPLGFVVREAHVRFRAPARIDDALIVRTRVVGARGARCPFHQSVERDGEILVEAEIEGVCIALDGGPRRMPEDVLKRLRPYLGA